MPANPDWLVDALSVSKPDAVTAICRLSNELDINIVNAEKVFADVVRELNAQFYPPLSKMELTVTEQCNLACTYCFEEGMKSPKLMSRETARKAIDLLFDYAAPETELTITFFGGEPMLNLPLIEWSVDYLKTHPKYQNRPLNLQMTSNGTLIDEVTAPRLAELGVRVLISIDGLKETNDHHRVYRSGRGSFDDIAQGIKALKPHQPWVGVKITVMPDDANKIFENVMGLREIGINQFIIGHATGVTWSDENRQYFLEQMTALKEWYERENPSEFRISDFEETDTAMGYFGCSAARSTIAISVDGQVSPCSKILGIDSNTPLALLGSVNYGLYRLATRRNLLSCSKLENACTKAGIAQTYKGGCFASNMTDAGDLFLPSMTDYDFSILWQKVTG
ncbi:MAG: radical SAM protein [Rhodospirillales bacterium]|nr:radical SAM protein [Rhodospirillales bacterium]